LLLLLGFARLVYSFAIYARKSVGIIYSRSIYNIA
jgi:hypothetical protein